MSSQYKTWVEINSKALRENIIALRSLKSEETEFAAIVKANAYGHDLDTIVRLATLESVKIFGVDSIDEALKVQKRAPESTVIILGYTVPERIEDVIRNGFVQTIYSLQSLKLMKESAMKNSKIGKVNLKVETGTNRQGIPLNKLEGFLREVRRAERDIELIGVSSHFADAENVEDARLTDFQLKNFEDALAMVVGLGFNPRFRHIACSAAAIHNSSTHQTLVRYGIALYGLWSSESLRRSTQLKSSALDLKPVLSLKSRIAQIKDVPSGEFVGYSRKYRADHPIRIAIIPVGYYDGYERSFSNKATVLVKGQKCPVVGSVCMNVFMVDVSTVPNVEIDDVVTLIGRDGMNEVSVEHLAEIADTINYEIVTQINPLLPRIVV